MKNDDGVEVGSIIYYYNDDEDQTFIENEADRAVKGSVVGLRVICMLICIALCILRANYF